MRKALSVSSRSRAPSFSRTSANGRRKRSSGPRAGGVRLAMTGIPRTLQRPSCRPPAGRASTGLRFFQPSCPTSCLTGQMRLDVTGRPPCPRAARRHIGAPRHLTGRTLASRECCLAARGSGVASPIEMLDAEGHLLQGRTQRRRHGPKLRAGVRESLADRGAAAAWKSRAVTGSPHRPFWRDRLHGSPHAVQLGGQPSGRCGSAATFERRTDAFSPEHSGKARADNSAIGRKPLAPSRA